MKALNYERTYSLPTIKETYSQEVKIEESKIGKVQSENKFETSTQPATQSFEEIYKGIDYWEKQFTTPKFSNT